MPNTFTQIYIQIVFAVKNRQSLIHPLWEDKLYQYITGIVQSRNQKMIAINGMPDHIHVFIGFKPSCSLSDLVREIKKSSSLFINQNKLCVTKFNWQEGYGAFSYSQSHISRVYAYISNQKEHHKKISFKSEYLDFLKKYEVEYEEKYLFDWI
jgi:REP element-mobilizing transposase RayT